MEPLLIITVLGLGVYNWYITTKYHKEKEQRETYHDLVIQMARELQELGSPNVKVIKDTDEDFPF